MINKTSKELRQIFDLNRDDMRYFTETKSILKPKKLGQGQAAKYSETDIERLLDIKILLLSGYKNQDMENIFTGDYVSDEKIAEQIRNYKRRILILEFIQKLRSNMKEANDYISEQSRETVKTTLNTLYSNGYEIKSFEDIYEFFLDMIKLIFIIDYLSQKESIEDKNIIKSLNRSKEAFDLIIFYSRLLGTNLKSEQLTKDFIELIDAPEEGDQETKAYAKEIVKKLNNKKRTFKRIMRKNWEQYTKEWGEQSGENYRERMMILYDFIFDYLADEETIYYLMKNFENFLRGLDRAALERGDVILPKNKIKDLYA